ncbi:MAG TPA: hemolysin III family protein [Holophagaceae bacterium]|nr:hemolysin III family protein [Holophagaceae bacterium]
MSAAVMGWSEEAKQELANSLTHGLGAALSVAGLALLVTFASLRGGPRHIVGAAVFGATLVLLYLMSTLYHAFRGPKVKKVFKILDHSAIYLLIAGTYTPFTLAAMRGAWGWSLFGVIWGLAALGIALKSTLYAKWVPAVIPKAIDHLHSTPEVPVPPRQMKLISTLLYLAMGWLVLIAIVPLWRALPAGGLAWLFGGGLCYSLGAAFYSWRSLRFHHAIWHLFVVGGSLCHFFAVLWFVIPAKGA